jgi:hypothetical protein
MDAIHLLVTKIKVAWHAKKVALVLFLDIEGAFPNMNPDWLVHNLKKQAIPVKYTNFIRGMLHDQATILKFDGFTSDWIPINNGIGQGDPLSMVLYQYYNANLLDIPKYEGEDVVTYVDDTFMLTTDTTFNSTHNKLMDMMCRLEGMQNWSICHGQATVSFVRSFVCVGPSGPMTARVEAKSLGSI